MNPSITQIRIALDDVYDTRGALAWLHQPNRQLDGRTPYLAQLDGDGELVMRIIDELAGGPRK